MNTIISQMLETYQNNSHDDKRNVIKEIMQEIVLCGLSRAGFFKVAAFYGGTALRIFYGLSRFSEDLDFSLQVKDETFSLNKYLPILKKEVESFGLIVEVLEKEKSFDSNIKSAFLKADTKQHTLLFYGGENIYDIHDGEKIKIKIEVDVNPPAFAEFEYKYRLLPAPYEITLYNQASLFAGKIHAVLCRSWKSRVKGRDLYDYVFYLTKQTPVNITHLRARLIDSEYLKSDESLTLSDLKERLFQHFENINYEQAKEDVKPFIQNIDDLNIWSADFFKQITEKLTCTTID